MEGSDLKKFSEINADPVVTEFVPVLSKEQTRSLLKKQEEHFEKKGYGLWAAEHKETGELAGFIGLNIPTFEAPFMPCIEIGWRLSPEFWGQGLATEGALETLEIAFEDLGPSKF